MKNYIGNNVEQFLEMLMAERGASHNTCISYLNDITNLDKFLSGAERSLEDATTNDIRRFLRPVSYTHLTLPTKRIV